MKPPSLTPVTFTALICSTFISITNAQGTDATFETFRWISIVFLVCMSGLFSGLTLGLLGLSALDLEILIQGSKDEATIRDAKKILKVRKDGNKLLCTLLFGNVLVNSAFTILLGESFGGLWGLIGSTFVIVIFGEIIPQAACHRYAIQVGARAVPIVVVFQAFLYPLAKPMALVLDKILGQDLGQILNRGEMRAFIDLYVERGAFDDDEGKVMVGALSYKDKCARDVMTPFNKVDHLKDTDKLDFATLSKIFKSGFSRLPVFSGHGDRWEDVCGMLLTKDLIMIDPEEAHNVMAAVQLFSRQVGRCYPDTKLSEVLKDFKSGESHMSIVCEVNNKGDGDPFYEMVGVVTMEDIIEEILQTEIVDETDVYVHMEHGDKVERDSFDFARLRLLDSTMTQSMSKSELRAVSVHLSANVNAFKNPKLTSDAMIWMLNNSSVLDIKFEPGQNNKDKSKILYRREKVDTFFTLILSGKIEILAGRDGVHVEYGAFQCLGESALLVAEGEYKPDFTANIVENVRCLRISRAIYAKGLVFAESNGNPELIEMRRRLSSKDKREQAISIDKEEQKLEVAKDKGDNNV